MKKISIVVLVLAFYGCVVPVSIGNKSIYEVVQNTDDVNDYINIVNYVDDLLIPQVEIYFEIEKEKKLKKLLNTIYYQGFILGNKSPQKGKIVRVQCHSLFIVIFPETLIFLPE